MSGNIWVLAECFRGRISEITFEVLALGRELADGLGVKLEAVLLGSKVETLTSGLGKADRVVAVDHIALAEPVPETYANVLAALARERRPEALLIGLTNVTMGMGTLVAAQLGSPVVNFCTGAAVRNGRLSAHCVLYGGKIEADVAMDEAVVPAVICVWPGARSPERGRADRQPPVETVAVEVAAARTVFRRYIEPAADQVDITRQTILVAVGRGIQSLDNLAPAAELAEALGGAVCGSRPVVDQGWLPLSRQVGKSGLTVKPKLYIAAGISGAPEHVEGMRDSELIIAINSDQQAPIFNVADLGIVGDAADVLPALTEAIRTRKGKSHGARAN